MKKIIFLLCSFLFISLFSQAQHNHNHDHDHSRCSSDHIHEQALTNNPQATQRMAEIEDFTQRWIANNQNQINSRSVITIPVVFHVVWNDPQENISMAQIQSQLDVLNTDFRKLNADTTFIPSVFQSLAADVEVEFCLAQTDPSGGPTTGVNRIQTTINQAGYFDSTLWHMTAPLWDTASYLNIYICEISDFGGILGYATRPGMPYNGLDGIVMDYRYFGTTGTATASAPYHLGRTLTHEVGHYLNLLHSWGNTGGCSDDDLVGDTPMQDGPNYGCNTHPLVSCTSPDMFMNYMDYGEDACLVMFSQGQKMRMLAALNGPRASLQNSMGCQPFIPTTIYVNHAANGANNGTSWTDAFTDLSDALNIAQTYSEIWVAQGTYHPGGANPSRFSYFELQDSVGIYGGFFGTETERSQRDFVTFETILSGDLLEDDVPGNLSYNKSDNSLHVIYADLEIDNITILDGFTIKGGSADIANPTSFDDTQGGGILNEGAPYIKNCIFEDNYAFSAGGAVSTFAVGAFWGLTEDVIQIEDCSFINNGAIDGSGGAVDASGGGLFKNCYFEENNSLSGGAISFFFGHFDVEGSVFENNTAGSGGAIRGLSILFPTSFNVTNCDFIQNQATDSLGGGGAIYAGMVPINIEYSIFDGNTAYDFGGAIYHSDEVSTITNSLIVNNTATGMGLGGAIYNLSHNSILDAELTLTNCTVANNQGTTGGIYQSDNNEWDPSFEVTPYVFLSNTILSNYNDNYAKDTVSAMVVSLYGNLSSDSTLATEFTHVSDLNSVDPMFRDTSNFDFRLNEGSPAHDLGLSVYAPPFDLDSLPRIGHPDAGAYEYPFAVSTEEPTISLSEDVKVYPNPTSDALTIEISDDWNGEVRFQLIDITGRMIRTWTNDKFGDFYQEQISTRELPSGLYQIVISQGSENKIVRFSKI